MEKKKLTRSGDPVSAVDMHLMRQEEKKSFKILIRAQLYIKNFKVPTS